MDSEKNGGLHKDEASAVQSVGEPGPDDAPSQASENPPKRRSLVQRGLRLTGIVAGVFWIAGTALRMTIRDRYVPSAVVFYALPVPLLAGCGLLFCCCLRARHRRLARLTFVIALFQVLCFSADSMRLPSFDRSGSTRLNPVRLVFWNVCRGYGGYTSISETLKHYDADVIAMVEATKAGQNVHFWRREFPGYECLRLGSGMVLLVRGRCLGWRHGKVDGVCRYRVLDVEVQSQQFTLAIVDIASNPLVSRAPAFRRLAELAARHEAVPFLIAGDFNTPPDSVWVDDLRTQMTNAYEQSGTGFRETWPVVLPVLGLDQVWGNSSVAWQSCRHEWSLQSDHRPVIVEFGPGP